MNEQNQSTFFLEAFYSGRVQGVGFRFRTSEIAEQFAVRGFVQNLRDGRVLLQTEGEENEVLAFQKALEEQLAPFIQGKEISTLERPAVFKDFTVRPT